MGEIYKRGARWPDAIDVALGYETTTMGRCKCAVAPPRETDQKSKGDTTMAGKFCTSVCAVSPLHELAPL
jgi:hypothetical protein